MSVISWISSLFFAFLASSVLASDLDLYIVNADIAPDGFTRTAVLAGSSSHSGTFPGPVITGFKGDQFSINVINELTNTTMLRSTSIHWHGLFQQKSSWADGPVGVTQCPIAPNNSFLYSFDVPDQSGTYWYHSHYGTQYCDGLRGAIVLYDPNDPYLFSEYEIDNESTIITLADWYHTPALGQAILNPSATLINGLGRFTGGPLSPLAVINVISGLRYRFRLVSLSCDPNFVFSIDGHTMTIIEADGVETKPLNVDSIQIYAGQRYSFVLVANRPINNYWIRANPNSVNQGFVNGTNSAILRYLFAPATEPTTNQTTSTSPLVETNLHPYVPSPVPGQPHSGGVDLALHFDFNINFATGKFLINNASFIPPTVPVLLQILSGAKTAQNLLPPGDVYVLPSNSVIEISIAGGGGVGFPHPFHLHGHNFWVVRSANSSTYNYNNPVIRDVVSTGFPGDNATFRFVTDNSGPWILHCHIDWHLNAGLAVVLAENVTTIAASTPPPAWDQLCPIYDALPPSSL